MPYFNDTIISHQNENKVKKDEVKIELKKIFDNAKNSKRDKRIIKNIIDH
jgi:hypothetical protein